MNRHITMGFITGFIIGGIAVFSTTATIDKTQPSQNKGQTEISTADHNAQAAAALKDLKGDDFDKAFIEEMILHHQGAVDMAKLIETNAKHNELKQLGQDIISAQSKEIDMMQTWQTDWGYKTGSQGHADEGH